MDENKRPPIRVTANGGDTLWLECFADNPAADHGRIICQIVPGDSWWALVDAVDRHIASHGC